MISKFVWFLVWCLICSPYPPSPAPITLHHLSSDKSENRFGLMQQVYTPLSKLIFSDMSRKDQILKPKTDSVSIQRTQNQHAWGNVELISAPSYRNPPTHTHTLHNIHKPWCKSFHSVYYYYSSSHSEYFCSKIKILPLSWI